MIATGFRLCRYIQFESLQWKLVTRAWKLSLNLMGFTDFFYKEMLISLISFSLKNTFSLNLLPKATVVQVKIYEFLQSFLRDQPYRFRDISQTSELKFQLDRDLFILMDFTIICIHFRNSKPPISLKIIVVMIVLVAVVVVVKS